MTIYAVWKLTAEELWAMGYRKCEYEPAPLMTKLRTTTAPMPSLPLPESALQQYRPKWGTAEEVEIREREHWRKRDEKAEEAYRRWVESKQVWPTIKNRASDAFKGQVMMQHTDERIAARLGKATASRIGDLMAKMKTYGPVQ